MFGGHLDGFNTYTQRGQFPKVQSIAESAVALIPFDLATPATASLGGHPGHDPGWQPLHLPHADTQPLFQRRLVLSGVQSDSRLGLVLCAHDRQGRGARPQPRYNLERFARGRELDEDGVGNWTYKQ